MVKAVRTAPSPGALRALNQPQAIGAETDDRGMPIAVLLGSNRLAVSSIEDVWRIEEEWWRDMPITRTYFEVLLEDGRRVTVFRDAMNNEWHQQRYG